MKQWYWYLAILCVALLVRMVGLTSFPPSLYWEEVALGYDAYSILQTARDHHGHFLPLVAFESFGDWKPSGYFYVLVPFVALFGLNAWAVRIPAVLAGVALIIGVAFLAKRLKISPLIAMAVGAVSPWAIQFSRAGWEVMTASAFLVWANVCFLSALEHPKIKWKAGLGGVILAVMAMYTYHATRLIIPLQLLGLAVLYVVSIAATTKQLSYSFWWKAWQKNWMTISVLLATFIVMTAPLLLSLGDATTNHRFQETSIFSDISVIERSNALKEQSGNSFLAKVFYHRYLLFGEKIAENFFSHFNLNFLFLSGDSNLRHSLQFYGQLYHIELLFILVGGYLWFRQRTTLKWYLWYWLVVAIVPASLTTGTPHALRILPSLPIFILLIATGIQASAGWLTTIITHFATRLHIAVKRSLITFSIFLLIGIIYGVEFTGFWRYYQKIYPVVASREWQYGYAEVMTELHKQQQLYPDLPVYITREQGRPAMYYWFYTKTDPREVQSLAEQMPKDQGEFLQFKQISFIDKPDQIKQPSILVSSSDFKARVDHASAAAVLRTVTNPQNQVIWEVYQLK